MISKRPFHDEECYEVACKQPRKQEHTTQQSPLLEISPFDNTLSKNHSDDAGETSFIKAEDEKTTGNDLVNEDSDGPKKEFEGNTSGSISSHWWVNNNVIDEYAKSDGAFYLSVFPNYFELDRRVRALVQSDDIYSTLLEHSPRKLVSVGPDHQADVPEWTPQGFKNCSDHSNESDDDYEKKLMGTCVLPMPDSESPAYNGCIGGGARIKCDCLDRGSIRCVRQHVMEARDRLREILGQMIVEELGFSDMGEEVAKKWSGVDEQVFHEVVLANPSSMGQKFWDRLSAIFSSRKKVDIVSYYFNVFMLQKRAEQNRFDPLNIDSDNDEWQRNEFGEEEVDDSVVESQVDQAIENEGVINNDSEAHIGSVVGDRGLDPIFHLSGEISRNYGLDHDIHTSYEYQNDLVTDVRVAVESDHK